MGSKMPKSKKAKAKYKDFQKVKLKIGKKLPKGLNETDASFKSRNIQVPDQLKTQGSEPTTKRKLNLSDLLGQCQHYNGNVRKDALVGLKELIATHPEILTSNIGTVVQRIAELLTDKDNHVRGSAIKLIKSILPNVASNQIAPFFPLLSAHLCCAMTHISDDIKLDSLTVLDTCLDMYPGLVTASSSMLLQNFIEQISQTSPQGSKANKSGTGGAKRSLLVNPNSKLSSIKGRIKVIKRLHKFLNAAIESREQISGNISNEVDTVCSKEEQSINWLPLGANAAQYNNNIKTFCLSSVNTRRTNDDIFTNDDKLNIFIRTVVPLLLESWVEVGPAEVTSSKATGTEFNYESISVLADVMALLKLIVKYVAEHNKERSVLSVNSLKSEYQKDLTNYVMVYFPFHSAQPTKKDKVDTSDMISIISVNLDISEMMLYMLQDATSANLSSLPWFNNLLAYITGTVFESSSNWRGPNVGRLAGPTLQQALRIIDRLLCLPIKEDFTLKLLDSVYRHSQRKHLSYIDHKEITLFFCRLLTSPSFRKMSSLTPITRWISSLPESFISLCKEPNISTTMVNCILDAMTTVASHGNALFLQALQEKLDKIISPSCVTKLGTDQQKKTYGLLTWLPRLNQSDLRIVSSSFQHKSISGAVVQFALNAIYGKICRAVYPRSGFIEDADILSFLFSLLIGYSKAELSDFKNGMEEVKDPRSWDKHVMIAKTCCSLLQMYHSKEQMYEIVTGLCIKLKNEYPRFPTPVMYSIILAHNTLYTSRAAITATVLQVLTQCIIQLLKERARYNNLTIGTSNVTMETNSAAMETTSISQSGDNESVIAMETNNVSQSGNGGKEICDVCIECIRATPGMLDAVTSFIIQDLSSHITTDDSLEYCITGLRELLVQERIQNTIRQSKQVLTDLVQAIEAQGIDGTTGWLHMFSMEVDNIR